MKLIRLKFAPQDGLSVLAHPDLLAEHFPRRFTLPDCRSLSDVDSFNVIATEHNWPRMRVDGWRDEVRRALVEIETDACPQHWRLNEKIEVSLMLMDLLDHDTGSIESALEKLRNAGKRRL